MTAQQSTMKQFEEMLVEKNTFLHLSSRPQTRARSSSDAGMTAKNLEAQDWWSGPWGKSRGLCPKNRGLGRLQPPGQESALHKHVEAGRRNTRSKTDDSNASTCAYTPGGYATRELTKAHPAPLALTLVTLDSDSDDSDSDSVCSGEQTPWHVASVYEGRFNTTPLSWDAVSQTPSKQSTPRDSTVCQETRTIDLQLELRTPSQQSTVCQERRTIDLQLELQLEQAEPQGEPESPTALGDGPDLLSRQRYAALRAQQAALESKPVVTPHADQTVPHRFENARSQNVHAYPIQCTGVLPTRALGDSHVAQPLNVQARPQVSSCQQVPQMPGTLQQCPSGAVFQSQQGAQKTMQSRVGTSGQRIVAKPEESQELTFMVRNIPNLYTPTMLLEEFAEWRQYIDFYYMPIDFKNGGNLGYAFVNFHNVAAAKAFQEKYDGVSLRLFPEFNKVLAVSIARVQGRHANTERFRNSSVMGVLQESFRPMVFDRLGNVTEFPKPDGGMFPSTGPRFRRMR